MKRFGQVIGVKPERLEEYKKYHACSLARNTAKNKRV
jgi:L-rhamnose mutarotase